MINVVLIGFNRPEHTERTLQAIRQVRPERVFLVADGPRADHPHDVELVARTRAVMNSIDWPCQIERRFSDVNLGCEGNVETGLDWVFDQVDDALIFEDDCIADPSFFAFATELLERYRRDCSVWQIAGNSHFVPATAFHGDSYRFAAWASVWGWATWADRWKQHRADFPRTHIGPDGASPVRTRPAEPKPERFVTRGGRAHFAEAATSVDNIRHGWDTQWWLTMMTHGALAATPAVNMVENIGFGAGATHGVYEHTMDPAMPMPMPLQHPEGVNLDVEVERDLELLMSRAGGPTVQLIRRLVTNPRLRTVGRKILHSNAMANTTRFASRLTDRGAPRD